MEKILNLYKQEGETPLETIERFKAKSNSNNLIAKSVKEDGFKMTYAGRLDPMAEGVLIVLVGEECKNKEKYLGLDKEYEFEILWGFKTDTYDILGLNQKSTFMHSDFEELELLIKSLKGKFIQKYPPYSSKTIKGKQLFELARKGKLKEEDIPEQEVEIYDIEFLGNYKLNKEELLQNITKRISKVTPNSSKMNGRAGDFRQKEIIDKWKKTLLNYRERENEKFVISKVKINCSSGTYIRKIVDDLGKKMGIGATTFRIKRIRVGDFGIQESK